MFEILRIVNLILVNICIYVFSDMGNYDIPRSPSTENYDIPRAISLEGNYDVPRSSEEVRSSADDSSDEEMEAPDDFAV